VPAELYPLFEYGTATPYQQSCPPLQVVDMPRSVDGSWSATEVISFRTASIVIVFGASLSMKDSMAATDAGDRAIEMSASCAMDGAAAPTGVIVAAEAVLTGVIEAMRTMSVIVVVCRAPKGFTMSPNGRT